MDLIVGLGNPGSAYESTRHNVGFWFVDELANHYGVAFKSERRFHGEVANFEHDGRRIYMLKPATYMNRSGQSVVAFCRYYKIATENVLVVHDELDLAPGDVRLKQDGGHGGHNGLRDVITALGGDAGFMRLRIGIGHPGERAKVVGYVLHKPADDERSSIENALEQAGKVMPVLFDGDLSQAQNRLHSRKSDAAA